MTRALVVEADGGSRGNPGQAAYGALVRDAETGDLLAERAARLGIASNNVAEYRGLLAGLQAAAEIDPEARLEVRLDSKLVVEQMSGRWKIKHPDMRELAVAARNAFDAQRVTYTWIPRADNAHADRLVNAALDGTFDPEDHSEGADCSTRTNSPASASRAATPARPRNRIVGWSTDLGTPTTVIVLRHGQTSQTAARVFSGNGGADPELSDAGRTEARAAAEALRGRGVAKIVTSPLRRCRQTAEIVAAELGLAPSVDDGFAEAGFGEWDGLPLDVVTERWGDLLAAWIDSADVAPPGGESTRAVASRVGDAVTQLCRDFAGQTVLVVTHVTPIKMLVQQALDAPIDAIYRLELPPASLGEIDYYTDGVVAVKSFGVTSHLPVVGDGL